jgi:hypothetical protein
LPLIGRARFKARCTACTSNLAQLSAAFVHYATDNNGHFPRCDMGGSAGNCWGVTGQFAKVMMDKHGVLESQFYCPVVSDDAAPPAQTPSLWAIGYMVWVPRIDTVLIPPLKVGDNPATLTYPPSAAPGPIAGPQRLGDSAVNATPILTDVVGTQSNLPHTANSHINDGFLFAQTNSHVWHGRLDQANQAFADGRVEVVAADAIRPRYRKSGDWNWR